MSALRINIDTHAADVLLARAKAAAIDRPTIHKVAAAAASKTIRAHLLLRNVRSVRSNYWSHAAESVRSDSDATSGRVIIPKAGVAWHRYGGTIHAKPGKALAIPLKAAVKGMWPSEVFSRKGDAFIYKKNGKAFLAAREGKALRIYYLLLKSVSKSADPTVLPSSATLSHSIQNAIQTLIHLRLSRAHTP